MPTYVYVCKKCGLKIEKVLPMKSYASEFRCRCGELLKKSFTDMVPGYHDVAVDSVEFDLTGKPIVYHTRGQLKKIAREHGCEVDFGQRSREVRGR